MVGASTFHRWSCCFLCAYACSCECVSVNVGWIYGTYIERKREREKENEHFLDGNANYFTGGMTSTTGFVAVV